MTIKDLPFDKPGSKVKTHTIHDPLYLEGWVVPRGVTIKLCTSQNFGYVLLPERCRDLRGFVIPRRLFRY